MDLLAPYHPYLTGAVLNGTAGRYAEIELELFADSSKDVEIDLLSRDISYETVAIRNNQPQPLNRACGLTGTKHRLSCQSFPFPPSVISNATRTPGAARTVAPRKVLLPPC